MTKSKATAKPAKPKVKRVKKEIHGKAFVKEVSKRKEELDKKIFNLIGGDRTVFEKQKPPFAVGQRWRMRNGGEAKIVRIEELRLYATHQVDGLNYEYFLDGEFYGRWGADYDLISLIEDEPAAQEKYYQNELQRALGKVRSWEAMAASQRDNIAAPKEKSHLEIKAEDECIGSILKNPAFKNPVDIIIEVERKKWEKEQIKKFNNFIPLPSLPKPPRPMEVFDGNVWQLVLLLTIFLLQIAGMVMP
jgi:hypothetical protein